MNFYEFAEKFGSKMDFVRSIPAHERTAFQHAAMCLHDRGFDWYIADDDLCFGVKPADSPRASPRGGRLWKSFKITINLRSKHTKAISPALLARLGSSGGVEMMHGSRISFSIAQFDGLVSDTEFINEFADLCGISKHQGLWPDQRRDIPKSQSEVTDIEPFNISLLQSLHKKDLSSDSDIDLTHNSIEEECLDAIPPDEVEKVLTQVRRNQGKFKGFLKTIWGAQCAVSKCTEEAILEAAHIIPYSVGRDYSKSNGLLLRADIHALFDAYLLSIDADGRVHVADSIKDIAYTSLQGQLLARPKDKWPAGLAKTLAERHATYLQRQGRGKSLKGKSA